MTDTRPALAGIRVLDLTQVISGPYATQILGDLGADVIKVEPPQGDLARTMPPHFVGPDSVYFLAVNRNKRSLAVDMKRPEGLDVVRRLALACDVVVENFRPGVLERLGLSLEALRAASPGLIWCSISGFGQDGPYRDKPAYDMIVQALSGGMSLTGEPGRPAVRSGLPIGDIAAGLYAVVAILAALRRRDRTGRGDVIDIAMLDCQAAMLTYQAAYYLHSGRVPGRQGSGHDSIPTYRSFATRNGVEIVVTAISERMWRNLARALGLEALAEDPRFRTNRDRYAHRRELWPLLEAAFLTRDAEDWIGMLEDLEIPVATVNTIDRVVEDPQIRHRGMVVALDARDGRQARVMGDPVAFREAPRSPHRYPPGLGEDVTVLRDVLGLSPAEIADLVSGGAVVERPPARRPDEQDA